MHWRLFIFACLNDRNAKFGEGCFLVWLIDIEMSLNLIEVKPLFLGDLSSSFLILDKMSYFFLFKNNKHFCFFFHAYCFRFCSENIYNNKKEI